MAYIDLCSAESYGSFNRKLARITNVITAVYWAEILAISTKVVKKETYNNNGYFHLDREYVEKMCSVSLEDQLTCDLILENLKLLRRDPADFNLIVIDVEAFTNLIISNDTKKLDIPKDPTKLTREQKSANKQEMIRATMKRCIPQMEEDLLNKYFSWVDSVYDSGHFLNKAKIQMFVDKINTYTNDKQVKLQLLDSAIISGYDNADWVINNYLKSNKPQVKRDDLPKQQSTTKYEFFN